MFQGGSFFSGASTPSALNWYVVFFAFWHVAALEVSWATPHDSFIGIVSCKSVRQYLFLRQGVLVFGGRILSTFVFSVDFCKSKYIYIYIDPS